MEGGGGKVLNGVAAKCADPGLAEKSNGAAATLHKLG